MKPKVLIFKATEDDDWPRNMWIGFCMNCSYDTQYWSWGATMGHMLEHRYLGCEVDRMRGEYRRRKYARLALDPDTEAQARLSCGGRTHGIMGESRRSPIRRADLPKYVSPRDQITALLAGAGSPPTDDRGPILGERPF